MLNRIQVGIADLPLHVGTGISMMFDVAREHQTLGELRIGAPELSCPPISTLLDGRGHLGLLDMADGSRHVPVNARHDFWSYALPKMRGMPTSSGCTV